MHMMRTTYKLILICLGALALRLALLPFIAHPGISDPNHYYNLGRELAQGQGFTIDYVWQYYNPPDAVVHPTDWWMPLTGVLVAGGMTLGGVNVTAALLPFVLIGALLPLGGYWAARQLQCSEGGSLFAAAAVGLLPELVLNSLRTNTLVPATLLVTLSLLLITQWLADRRAWLLLAAGASGGLAYLTRSESTLLLPMFAVMLVLVALAGRPVRRGQWGTVILAGLVALIVVAPWLWRNYDVHGWLTPPNQQRIFFWTDFRDLYAYERDLTWDTMTEVQTMREIVGKRVFEMAASTKIMFTALDNFLPVAVAGGLLLLLARRDWERLLALAPAIVLLGGFFVFYTILAPFFSQGGSFKKAYLSLVPLLIPAGVYALEAAIPDRRLRYGTMLLVGALLAANAVEMVRADVRETNNFVDEMEQVVDVLETLPDTNGDGERVLMTQDQFMLSFLGVRSVAIPMEPREKILAVAQRYGVDYLLMPPARPALDPIHNGRETDPRFVPVADVPGTNNTLYGFDFDAQP